MVPVVFRISSNTEINSVFGFGIGISDHVYSIIRTTKDGKFVIAIINEIIFVTKMM